MAKRKRGSQSAGYHSDLSIPGYKPKTPTVAPSPGQAAQGPAGDYAGAKKEFESAVAALPPEARAVTEAASSSAARSARRRVRRAEHRQRRAVDRFVTKAYERKVGETPAAGIGRRVEKAKGEVAELRDRLLNSPDVKGANAEGKVVSPQGLSKLHQREVQYHAIKGPQGVSESKAFGLEPRSLQVGSKGWKKLATSDSIGEVGRHRNEAQTQRELKGAPSTIEALSIASLGVPGLGVGADVAKLAQLGAKAIPELATREGAEKLLLQGATSGARGAARTKALPAKAIEGVKGVPATLRASPQIVRAGARGAPGALRGAAKATPAALGRGALRGAENTYKAGGGLALLSGTQSAGIHTPPGKAAQAILEGGTKAVLEHPVETGETTLRALPSAVTAPGALALAAAEIPFEGTGPFEETAKSQFEGLKEIGANLLSGDPKRTQKAFQKEGALSLLTPLPALSRTRAYDVVRGDARRVAAAARRKAGKGRIAPPGVEQGLFGFTERSAARKRVALSHSRESNPFRVSEARHTEAILHGTARKPALSGAPEGSHVALQTLLEYGIRSPEGVRLVREHGPKTGPTKGALPWFEQGRADVSREGKVNLHEALKYAEEHPEIFTDKKFNRALKAGERASKTTPAAIIQAGEVARHRAQGDVFKITPPEKLTPPEALKFTSEKLREGAWKQVGQMEARVTNLKMKGSKAPRRKAELKALERRVDGLKKALDPYTRPGQKSLSGERRPWSDQMAKEYVGKVQAKQKGSPLVVPVWTHHSTFRSRKMGVEGSALPGTAGGKAYVRKGSLAEHDLVDRSIEAFIRGTVQMPRRRAAGAAFGREFVRSEKLSYLVGGKAKEIVPDSETWARITGKKTKENPEGGQFDPNTYARFPLRQWKSAVKDPFTKESDLNKIVADAEAGQIVGHEPSVIVPRESIKEFAEAVNPDPGTVTEIASKWSRRASKTILLTNPAWAIAQIPAEGIPLVLAHPELLNPLKTGSIMKDIHAYRESHPEEAAMIEGSAGASPQITAGTLNSALDVERQGTFNPQPAVFSEGAKAMTRGRFGRAMISTAKLEPLGLFDVKRQNAFRTVLLAAEADKQFRSFTSGVKDMFRTSSKISHNFRGKSREEMWTWLSTTKEGRVELRKLSDYVDNIQGNWTSFTRYERAFAPLTIFYPFLRYSLRWTLWTFPRTHPITATIAYMLGQVNANELEKLLGAKPASPLTYSFPVVKDAQGKASVLPGGSRIAPGQSGPQQAVATGEAPQLVGSLNPFLGAALVAAGGPGPFGQKPAGPAGWAAVDQLLALPAPLRVMGIKSEDIASKLGLVRPQPQSVISKAYEKLDPEKAKRSVLFPPLAQSGENARMSNVLSRALKEASANSKQRQGDVAGDDSLTVQARQKQVAKMKKRSEAAGDAIDSVLKKLGLDKENKAAYERWKAAMYEGKEAGGGIYDEESLFDKKTIYEEGGSIYGDNNEKALKYKPPGAGSIKIPGLPLGDIGQSLGDIVGGAKAQAATTVPTPQATANAMVKQGIPPGKALTAAKGLSPAERQRLLSGGPTLSSRVRGNSARQNKANQKLGAQLSGWGLDAQKAASIARASKKYGVPAPLLAAIGKVESSNGTSTLPGVHSGQNSAGAAGPFQMGNGTGAAGDAWQTHAAEIWGNKASGHSVYNYDDAAMAAAHYLQVAGVTQNPATWNAGALAYNHAQWYADEVVSYANQARSKLWNAAGGRSGGLPPKRVMTRYQAAITAASQLNHAKLPYVLGGGHNPGAVQVGSGVDCSGAVSYVLQKMGVKLPGGVTSGQMGSYLRPGPGAVTVFYNPDHTFMKIGDRYFGTSRANPGGGAGFIPTSYEKGEAMSGKYNVGHIAGLGKKVAVQLGIPLTNTGSTAAFPGMTIANSGTTASIDPGAAVTQGKTGFSERPIRLTPAEKLKQVNSIFEGDLSQFGISSGKTGRLSASALSALGASLEAGRQELQRL